MSPILWKIGSEKQLRLYTEEQDDRFQDAMRQELRALAAERGLKLAPPKVVEAPEPAPTPAPPKPRDMISIQPTIVVDQVLSEPQKIMRDVCNKHGISKSELLSPRRAVPIVAARHEAMYRMSKETTMSLPAIGRRMGGRDHTTVLHGIRKYEASLRGERYVRPSYSREGAGV